MAAKLQFLRNARSARCGRARCARRAGGGVCWGHRLLHGLGANRPGSRQEAQPGNSIVMNACKCGGSSENRGRTERGKSPRGYGHLSENAHWGIRSVHSTQTGRVPSSVLSIQDTEIMETLLLLWLLSQRRRLTKCARVRHAAEGPVRADSSEGVSAGVFPLNDVLP